MNKSFVLLLSVLLSTNLWAASPAAESADQLTQAIEQKILPLLQKDMETLLKVYESSASKAVIEKMPQVAEKAQTLAEPLLAKFLSELQSIAKQAIGEVLLGK